MNINGDYMKLLDKPCYTEKDKCIYDINGGSDECANCVRNEDWQSGFSIYEDHYTSNKIVTITIPKNILS